MAQDWDACQRAVTPPQDAALQSAGPLRIPQSGSQMHPDAPPPAPIRTRYLPSDDLTLFFRRLVGASGQPPPFARIGPIHFQPLEWELAPVAQYLSGRLLNAGCGNRDITPFALEQGASEVVNYDMASDLPGAIIGPLEDLPFADGEFHSILCNAVLEHVRSPDPVMREMRRVLQPGGHLIASAPFLQPFHPCPGDFRRYTRDGMGELGVAHGFEVVTILPVHNIAQTLGWITWQYLCDKKSRVRRWLLAPLLWCFTRYCSRSDDVVHGAINTFQAVYRKPT